MWRRALVAVVLAMGCGGADRAPAATAPPAPPAAEKVVMQAPASSAEAASPPLRADSRYIAALKATLGKESELSLEPALQATIEDALLATGKSGAVIALDPNDGSVRALFSVPGDRGDPLITPQHPASTFKSFAALAALTSGTLTPDTVLSCRGAYDFAGAHLTCPDKHGPQNLAHALATSCNAFFYEAAVKLDPARLVEISKSFGFGARTGIELADAEGVVPAPPDKAQKKTARPLVDAIGHGDYLVTLVQLARAYAAIANGGRLLELHMVRGRRGADGTLIPAPRLAPQAVAVSPEALLQVRAGLADTVNAEYGRAHEFAIEGYPFAGKTGGSNAPPREGSTTEELDSWFVAFAPIADPKILVAARLERVTKRAPAAKLVADVLRTLR